MEYKESQIPPLSPQDKAKTESIFNRMRGPYRSAVTADIGVWERKDLEVQELEEQLDKALHIPEESGRLALNYEDRKRHGLDHFSTSRSSDHELYRTILSNLDFFKALFDQASPEVQEVFQVFIRNNELGVRPKDEDRKALYDAIDEASGVNLRDYEESKKNERKKFNVFYHDMAEERTVSVDELIEGYVAMLKASLAHAQLENWILEKRFAFFDQLANRAGLKIIKVPYYPDGIIYVEKSGVTLPENARNEIKSILDKLHQTLLRGHSDHARWLSEEEFNSKFGKIISDSRLQIEQVLNTNLPEDKRSVSDEDQRMSDWTATMEHSVLISDSQEDLVRKLFSGASPKIQDSFSKYRHSEQFTGRARLLSDIDHEIGIGERPSSGIYYLGGSVQTDAYGIGRIITFVMESITVDVDDVVEIYVARNTAVRRKMGFESDLVEKRSRFFEDLADKAGLKIVKPSPDDWPVLAEKGLFDTIPKPKKRA